MKLQTEKGEITISSDVFTNITGAAATNCYGVKGMAMRSKTDGLVHLLRRESMGKGVKVTYNEHHGRGRAQRGCVHRLHGHRLNRPAPIERKEQQI